MEFVNSAGLFSGFISVHRWAVRSPQEFDKLCRTLVVRNKVIRVPDHRYPFLGYAGLAKAVDDVRVHTPGQGTDEPCRRRRRERRADFQELRHEGWIVWNPVPHHYAAALLGDAHHLLRYFDGLRRKHGAEHRKGQIKRTVVDPLQVARIARLEFQAGETRLRCSFGTGLNEVSGNIDANNLGAQKGERNRRRAVSAAKI